MYTLLGSGARLAMVNKSTGIRCYLTCFTYVTFEIMNRFFPHRPVSNVSAILIAMLQSGHTSLTFVTREAVI